MSMTDSKRESGHILGHSRDVMRDKSSARESVKFSAIPLHPHPARARHDRTNEERSGLPAVAPSSQEEE
jgi:hypothetical protein